MAYSALEQGRIDAGLCRLCAITRGRDGTGIHCRTCADELRERTSRRNARLKREGRCIFCGDARGERGTNDACRPCADANSARTTKARRLALANKRA